MSVTIDLPPEVEASLAAQAAARGVSLAEHLRRLLVAHASSARARETPEERIKLWRDVSGLPDTKPLCDEAISRESIYSEPEEDSALAAELLALGRDCATRLKEPWRSADHAVLLYDEAGLPR
jgi:hypothetical protein